MRTGILKANKKKKRLDQFRTPNWW